MIRSVSDVQQMLNIVKQVTRKVFNGNENVEHQRFDFPLCNKLCVLRLFGVALERENRRLRDDWLPLFAGREVAASNDC